MTEKSKIHHQFYNTNLDALVYPQALLAPYIMEVSENFKSFSSLFPPIHNTRFLGDNFKMLNFLSFSKLCNDTGT